MSPERAIPKLDFKLDKPSLMALWLSSFDRSIQKVQIQLYTYLIEGDDGLDKYLANVTHNYFSQTDH